MTETTRKGIHIISTAARILLGGMFVYAGTIKAMDPIALAEDIANYRMLPGELVPLMTAAMPGVEIVVGALLITGIFIRASATMAAIMLAAFTIALAQAATRGLNIECGCFGGAAPVDGWVIGRDIVLLVGAAFVAKVDRGMLSLRRSLA